jgi:Na+/H+ antiporter NhaD/arsenite permease-like protein
MIIASLSGLSYIHFVLHCGPAMLVCLTGNLLGLCWLFRDELSQPLVLTGEVTTGEDEGGKPTRDSDVEISDLSAPAITAVACSVEHTGKAQLDASRVYGTTTDSGPEAWEHSLDLHHVFDSDSLGVVSARLRTVTVAAAPLPSAPVFPEQSLSSAPMAIPATASRPLVRRLIGVVFIGTLLAFLFGAPLSIAAGAGAAMMMAVDFREPDAILAKVDWMLLVFFAALFIVMQGFVQTGLPESVWNQVGPLLGVDTAAHVSVFVLLVVAGSNTISNVPLVLLMSPMLPTLPQAPIAWLLLSFVSTVAGNLTLVGSVANLIVAERAKSYHVLTFIEYARFGIPSTILVTVIGTLLVQLTFVW